MSQSPEDATETSKSYRDGWSALYELIRQGKSFSGKERHCVFLNTGGTQYADVSAVTGLDLPDDGRGLAVVDWNGDGAQDFWVTNRTGPRLRLFENRARDSGHFVAFRLRGTSCNRDAIGAKVEVRLAGESERRFVKSLHAGDGFLSQSSKWVHFGLGAATDVRDVVVRWPGGAEEVFEGVSADGRYLLAQGTGRATPVEPAAGSAARGALTASTPEPPAASRAARVPLAARLPLLGLAYTSAGTGARVELAAPGAEPLLVNLWGADCANCRRELLDLTRRRAELEAAGLEVVALNVDAEGDRERARSILEKLRWPFASGYADKELLELLEIVQEVVIDGQREMVLPTSFLIDEMQRLACIYKGPLAVDTLLADVAADGSTPEATRAYAAPFAGRWAKPPVAPKFVFLMDRLRRRGFTDVAGQYLERLQLRQDTDELPESARQQLAGSHLGQGIALARDGQLQAAAAALQKALAIDPDSGAAHMELGTVWLRMDQPDRARAEYARAVELLPDDGDAHYNLGLAFGMAGELAQAIAEFEKAVACDPEHHVALYNLGAAYGNQNRMSEALASMTKALALKPDYLEAQRSVAMVYQHQREWGKASAAFEKALGLEPNDEQSLYGLGLVLAKSGDHGAARRQHALLESLGSKLAARLASEILD